RRAPPRGRQSPGGRLVAAACYGKCPRGVAVVSTACDRRERRVRVVRAHAHRRPGRMAHGRASQRRRAVRRRPGRRPALGPRVGAVRDEPRLQADGAAGGPQPRWRAAHRGCRLRRVGPDGGELLALTWLFTTAVGVTILAWNRSFLTLWVGADKYAGTVVNLLLVIMAMQTAFIRADSYIIDAALQSWLRVVISVAAVVVTVALAIVFTRAWGLPGLCFGVIVGRLTQTATYPLLAHRSVGYRGASVAPRVVHPL